MQLDIVVKLFINGYFVCELKHILD